MENKEDRIQAAEEVQQMMAIAPIPSLDYNELVNILSLRINQLISTDFAALVHILYRMDIPENYLRTFLASNKNNDAGKLIADVMIRRQVKRIEYRKKFKQSGDIPEDEKW